MGSKRECANRAQGNCQKRDKDWDTGETSVKKCLSKQDLSRTFIQQCLSTPANILLLWCPNFQEQWNWWANRMETRVSLVKVSERESMGHAWNKILIWKQNLPSSLTQETFAAWCIVNPLRPDAQIIFDNKEVVMHYCFCVVKFTTKTISQEHFN